MQRRQLIAHAGRAGALLHSAHAQEGGLGAKTVGTGSSVALSGPLAVSGQDTQKGMDAALAQINARGGVHGRTLQLNLLDDNYQPQRTLENMRQLPGQGSAFALISFDFGYQPPYVGSRFIDLGVLGGAGGFCPERHAG